MKKLLEKIVELDGSADIIQLSEYTRIEGVRIGRISAIKQDGQILIDYQDNSFGQLKARTVIDVAPKDAEKSVLLVFENNDPQLPVIIGFVRDKAAQADSGTVLEKRDLKDVLVDGKRLVFDAEKEIELRCGKSSLIMTKDGRIVIKGDKLLSRAREINKIKGAAVRIN